MLYGKYICGENGKKIFTSGYANFLVVDKESSGILATSDHIFPEKNGTPGTFIMIHRGQNEHINEGVQVTNDVFKKAYKDLVYPHLSEEDQKKVNSFLNIQPGTLEARSRAPSRPSSPPPMFH
jgi:hypothetical protein